jgi:hypothetical protein
MKPIQIVFANVKWKRQRENLRKWRVFVVSRSKYFQTWELMISIFADFDEFSA